MKSVINKEKEIIIKNSRFICIVYNVNNIEDVNKYIKKIKNKYKNATHYCYAYIINNKNKCSDDGEPSNTAGIPMLEVLKKNELNNVLAITVRYFGGIKLGSSGLLRAYTKSLTNVLEDSIKELVPGYNIDIEFNYTELNKINYTLKDCKILNKEFNQKITYNVNITKDKYNILKNTNKCNIKINNNIYL